MSILAKDSYGDDTAMADGVVRIIRAAHLPTLLNQPPNPRCRMGHDAIPGQASIIGLPDVNSAPPFGEQEPVHQNDRPPIVQRLWVYT